jgi:hypothetical protein
MTRDRLATIVDREGAISELKRLAKILWDVHHKGIASREDTESVYDILAGWHAIARDFVTPREMIGAIYEVTRDLEFSLNTVHTLFPGALTENSKTGLQ